MRFKLVALKKCRKHSSIHAAFFFFITLVVQTHRDEKLFLFFKNYDYIVRSYYNFARREFYLEDTIALKRQKLFQWVQSYERLTFIFSL